MKNGTGPTVSVIIPALNAARYIGRAVSSAMESEDVSFEVIVVDDGSEDGTWQLLEDLGPRIRTARQDRGGPYVARNLGAGLARGEWLAFLDADDEWEPSKLSKQLRLADESTGLVYTDRVNIGDLSRVSRLQSDSVRLWEGDVFEPLLLGNFITLSSVLMRKSWFDRLGGFEVGRRGVQDWDLWLRYAAAGGLVRLCREPLTRYRIHAQQMSNDLKARALDRESVLRQALRLPRGRHVSARTVRKAFASVWTIGAWQAAADQPGRAIAWYLRAASYWPWDVETYKAIAKCCLGRP